MYVPETHFNISVDGLVHIWKFQKATTKLIMSLLTMNCSTSLSMPTLGRSGIMWATTLKPASFARWKDSHTARTVWPLEETQVESKFKGRRGKLSHTIKPAAVSLRLLSYLHPSPPTSYWPVCVAGHVFVHALDSNLQPGAAVAQHVTEVSLQAVVRPRLDGDSHTLGVTALRVPAAGNRLSHLHWLLFPLMICLYRIRL